jgi:RNA polymerase sigma-70 factor (ECF subfamily)
VYCSKLRKCYFRALDKAKLGPKDESKAVDKFSKAAMSDYVIDLAKDVSVKAPENSDDLELIHRSQAGDTEAFGELVTKYRAKIYAMLYSIVRNENDAWDLAQEGFLQAWRSIHKFEGRSSFYTGLYRLTVNRAIDSLRRKRRCVEVELDDAIPCSLPSPRANYRGTEISEFINAALAQLSLEHRAVIVLKEIEDLQYQEIGDILNISIGTVMSRLFYGRRKLQSILRPIFNQVYDERPPLVRSIQSKART